MQHFGQKMNGDSYLDVYERYYRKNEGDHIFRNALWNIILSYIFKKCFVILERVPIKIIE